MRCRRCHGLTIVDTFIDMNDGSGFHWLYAWRCVNCGDVTAPGITLRRRLHRSLITQFIARLTKTWQRKTEPIPLGT